MLHRMTKQIDFYRVTHFVPPTWARCLCLIALGGSICAALAVSSPASAPDDHIPGMVVAIRTTQLSAPMQGRLQPFSYVAGNPVSKGAILAKFDCRQQEAAHRSAKIDAETAQRIFGTYLQLDRSGASAALAVNFASTELNKALLREREATLQVARCKIVSDSPGIISKVYASGGQEVQVGQPVFDVSTTTLPSLSLRMPARLASVVRVGATVQVHVRGTTSPIPAMITAVGAVADSSTQTVEAEARFAGSTPSLAHDTPVLAYLMRADTRFAPATGGKPAP